MSRDVERLVREARSALPEPSARATMEAREAVVGAMLRRRRGRLRATAAVVVLGVATLAGIGAGLLIAPSGGAADTTTVAGLGFLPAKGWTIVQAAPGPATHSAAIASSVPVHPGDVAVDGPPYRTIQTLRADGVVIYAVFTARGSVWTDLGYPPAADPPRLDEVFRETSWADQIRPQDPVAQYRFAFSTGGYNVEVRVYMGRLRPTAGQMADAQRQLDRMVVAGEPVSMRASPAIVPWGASATLTGAVASGRGDETVEIQERRCGSTLPWTPVAEAHTEPGGGWHIRWGPLINLSMRAVWKGNTSNVVTLKARPGVQLRQVTKTRFNVGILALKRFGGRNGVLERYDRSRGRFVAVKRFRFVDAGAAGISLGTTARVTAALPAGTLVRAVLPRTAAGPCYLAGYSNMLRTR